MPSLDQIRLASVLPSFMEPGSPLLGDRDLESPHRFIKITHVPLIDVHDDPIKGNINLDLLKLIMKNSNDRVDKGEPIVVTVGHMKRKNTIVVVRPDGSKIILPGTDEANQPPIIGYAKNLTIDKFRDNDWLHGDFYIKSDHAQDPVDNPFRSVERVVPPDDGNDDGDDATRHYIDRISLLRTPPEREGGVLHYGREDDIMGCCGTTRSLLKICYSRDDTPLKENDMPMPVPPNGAPPPEMDDEGPGGAPPMEDDEGAPPPMEEEGGGEEGGGLPSTVGEMSPQDFFEGFAHVLRLVLDEKGGGEPGGGEAPEGPEGGGETVPYEKNLDNTIKGEQDVSKRVPYGQSTQAGGSNTTIPGSRKVDSTGKVDKTTRKQYERRQPTVATRNGTKPPVPPAQVTPPNLKEVITRVQYAKDKGETDEILTYLYGQLSDMQLNGRRIVYSQTLHGLRDMEGVDLADEDIETLVNAITDMTPEDHENSKVAEIRKYYSRRAVNVPPVHVGLPPYVSAGSSAERPATPEECRKATALRMDSGGKLSYAEALVAARTK